MEFGNIDVNLSTVFIDPSIGASMFTKRVHEDCPPIDRKIIEYNNEWIKNIQKNLWEPLSNSDGKISCLKLNDLLFMETDKKAAKAFIQYEKVLPRMTDTQVEFWLSFFRKSVSDLAYWGHSTISWFWKILNTELFFREIESKMENVFYLEDTVLMYDKYRYFMDNKWALGGVHKYFSPEELIIINRKLDAVASIRPEHPRKGHLKPSCFLRTTWENAPDTVREAYEISNAYVEKWISTLPEGHFFETEREMYYDYLNYLEGIFSKRIFELSPYFSRTTEEQLQEIVRILEGNVEELCDIGTGMLNKLFSFVLDFYLFRTLEIKIKKVFSKPEISWRGLCKTFSVDENEYPIERSRYQAVIERYNAFGRCLLSPEN